MPREVVLRCGDNACVREGEGVGREGGGVVARCLIAALGGGGDGCLEGAGEGDLRFGSPMVGEFGNAANKPRISNVKSLVGWLELDDEASFEKGGPSQ